MKNTILIITRTTANNNVRVSRVSESKFAMPNSWLFEGSYRGTDSYIDSAGACITVEKVAQDS